MSVSAQFPQINAVLASKPSSSSSAQTEQTMNPASPLFDGVHQTLSEQRASSVRAYLIAQGLGPNTISATGFGLSNPVADNGTPQGRQKNRRVEIVVSGEIIGTKIGSTRTQP